MKAMSTQTMIIIAAISVLVIGTIIYYAVTQRRSSFEDGDMPTGSPDMDMMSDDESDDDVPMVPEDDSDPE